MARAISGLGLTVAAGGAVLAYSALVNAPVADTLRALIRGQRPTSSPSGTITEARRLVASSPEATASRDNAGAGGSAEASAGTGTRVAAAARAYVDVVPYRWGGASAAGADCSGLVNLVLGHDLGLPIPDHPDGRFTGHGPVVADWVSWSGVRPVDRGQLAPGDLVTYGLGHMGIASGSGRFIAAPTAGRKVVEQAIYRGAAFYRPTSYLGRG